MTINWEAEEEVNSVSAPCSPEKTTPARCCIPSVLFNLALNSNQARNFIAPMIHDLPTHLLSEGSEGLLSEISVEDVLDEEAIIRVRLYRRHS